MNPNLCLCQSSLCSVNCCDTWPGVEMKIDRIIIERGLLSLIISTKRKIKNKPDRGDCRRITQLFRLRWFYGGFQISK